MFKNMPKDFFPLNSSSEYPSYIETNVLFRTPQSSPRKHELTSSTTPQPGLGYFVFPLDTKSPSNVLDAQEKKLEEEENKSRVADTQQALDEQKWQEEKEKQEQIRQLRLSRETEEARRGEEDWVRSGGILRDLKGNRDYIRTEAVREELKLREVEKHLRERWETYERRWSELLKGKGKNGEDLKFADIPWPAVVEDGKQVQLEDLTGKNIEEFFLGDLKIRGNIVTKKDRVRTSLLRWHPDKLIGIHARMANESLEDFNQGVGSVVICLQRLNANI